MKTIFILVIGIVTTITISQAQVNSELNKMILQSFGYFPRLQELNKSAEIGELRIDIAQSNYLPTINGTASYSYISPIGEATFPVSATETRVLRFQPNNNYNVNVGLNQVIYDFGKSKAQIEKAKADLLTTKQNTESAKLQVASQIVSIYYCMIYLQKAIHLQDTVIYFYEQNKKIIEGKIRQGDALTVDLANISNSLDQEKIRQLEFKRQYERQAALFTYSTGQTALITSTNFDFQTTSIESNFSTNPDIISANQRVESAKADDRLASSNRLPSLSMQASAGIRNAYQPSIEELRFNYLGGLTLNVPVFQGNRLNQNSSIARKSIELSEIAKKNLEATLQKDWQSARVDLATYEEQVKNADSQIIASREALRLTQVRYNKGVATYLDLVFALTNLQRSLLNQLQYEYQATLSKVELARLQGVKFWKE
jgi:outer membrane protein